jgi:tight adherence protein B
MTALLAAAGVLLAASLLRSARRVRSRPPSAGRPQAASPWRAAWTVRHRRWQARRRFADALPSLLDDIARAVRSGSSLPHACAEAAAAGSDAVRVELAAVVARAGRGLPLATALGHWSRQHRSPDVRVAGAALSLAASAGGARARAVDGVASTVRERRAAAAEVRAQSAQARLSAIVIGLLPVAFLLWAVGTDGRTAAFLVADPIGWMCLVAGILLDAIGALWMRRILRTVAP